MPWIFVRAPFLSALRPASQPHETAALQGSRVSRPLMAASLIPLGKEARKKLGTHTIEDR